MKKKIKLRALYPQALASRQAKRGGFHSTKGYKRSKAKQEASRIARGAFDFVKRRFMSMCGLLWIAWTFYHVGLTLYLLAILYIAVALTMLIAIIVVLIENKRALMTVTGRHKLLSLLAWTVIVTLGWPVVIPYGVRSELCKKREMDKVLDVIVKRFKEKGKI